MDDIPIRAEQPLPSLPALKGLGRLADIRPVIIIDNREQAPLEFTRLASVRGTLQSGDYSVVGCETLFSIERKSISDLTGCVAGGRDRFERELHRLRGFRFARLLIVGSVEAIEAGEYRSKIKPKAVLNTLSAFETRYNIPVIYEATPELAARRVESWAYWFSREIATTVNELLRSTERVNQ